MIHFIFLAHGRSELLLLFKMCFLGRVWGPGLSLVVLVAGGDREDCVFPRDQAQDLTRARHVLYSSSQIPVRGCHWCYFYCQHLHDLGARYCTYLDPSILFFSRAFVRGQWQGRLADSRCVIKVSWPSLISSLLHPLETPSSHWSVLSLNGPREWQWEESAGDCGWVPRHC